MRVCEWGGGRGQGRKEPLQGQHGNITSRRDEAGSELRGSGRRAREWQRREEEEEEESGPDQGHITHLPRDQAALSASGKVSGHSSRSVLSGAEKKYRVSKLVWFSSETSASSLLRFQKPQVTHLENNNC